MYDPEVVNVGYKMSVFELVSVTKSPVVAMEGRCLMASVRLSIAERKRFSRADYSLIHSMVTLLYRALQSTLWYDTVIRHMWEMAVSDIADRTLRSHLQPNRFRQRHGYHWQPRHRPIRRYLRRTLTTCRLAAIHTLETTDRRQLAP